ncbi:MAG: radical SAM protein [Leptonema sp. (in: bacteria)]
MKKIYIDKNLIIEKNQIVQNTIQNIKNTNIQVEFINNPKEIFDSYSKGNSLFKKNIIVLYKYNGKFLSSCPGSDGMVCCQYFVINLGIGCIYDCHYCYLQNFMNQPLITVFGNVEDALEEIYNKIYNKNFHFRIGTGEYSDSLALDPIFEISKILIEFFSKVPNATLELKTKSNSVDHLLNLSHNKKTVVSWSLNPQKIIDKIEPGTASLEERILAAKKVLKAGYKVGFHLDPMIYFDAWEESYKNLLDLVFDTIDTDRIAWISLGTFRYSPGQKEIMQKRFFSDTLTKEEMVVGNDGKFRYYKQIRYEMYSKIKEHIQKRDPKLFFYLCMETQYMWEKIFYFVPESSKNLDLLFEKRRLYMDSLIQA